MKNDFGNFFFLNRLRIFFRCFAAILPFAIFFSVLGFAIADLQGLFICSTLYFGSAIAIYFLAEGFVEKKYSPVRRLDLERGLISALRRIAQKMNMPPPTLIIFSSPNVSAFVLGRNNYSAKIYVSDGFLFKLKESEVEAALTHLLVQLNSGYVQAICFANVCLSLVPAMKSNMSRRWIRDLLAVWIFSPLLLPVLALLMPSRKQIFNWDKETAIQCGNSFALIAMINRFSNSGLGVSSPGIGISFFGEGLADRPWLEGVVNFLDAFPSAQVRIDQIRRLATYVPKFSSKN